MWQDGTRWREALRPARWGIRTVPTFPASTPTPLVRGAFCSNVKCSPSVILLGCRHFTTQETQECVDSGTNFEQSSSQNMRTQLKFEKNAWTQLVFRLKHTDLITLFVFLTQQSVFLSGAAIAPVGRRLAGGPQEHLEGKTNLGAFREVATVGGGGPDRLGKVLPRGGSSGVTIWSRDLGAEGSNGT